MKFKEMQDALNAAYSANPLVNCVYDNSNKINQKSTKYWCIAYDIVSVTETEDYTTYQYNIYALERMDDAQLQINDHYSTGMEILKDGFDRMEQDYGVIVNYPISYQMNSVRFADINDVVMANVAITTENADCE